MNKVRVTLRQQESGKWEPVDTSVRANIPARNYGRVDGESIGQELNRQLMTSWSGMRYWRKEAKVNPHCRDIAFRYTMEVLILCRIRKAGRIGL